MSVYKEKKIAVVGVSRNQEKYGYQIFSDLVAAGYDVSGVNQAGGEAAGRKLFRSLKEISPRPDLVITVVPPESTEAVIADCRALGIKEVWMQPGSESPAAIGEAKASGVSVISGACFMVQERVW